EVLRLLDDVEDELAVFLLALEVLVEPVVLADLGLDLALALPLVRGAELALALDPDPALEVVAVARGRDGDVPAALLLVPDREAGRLALVEVFGAAVNVLDHRGIAGEREAR